MGLSLQDLESGAASVTQMLNDGIDVWRKLEGQSQRDLSTSTGPIVTAETKAPIATGENQPVEGGKVEGFLSQNAAVMVMGIIVLAVLLARR